MEVELVSAKASHWLTFVDVESEMTEPFVIITNQKQWEAGEGTLLRSEAFSEHVPIQLVLTQPVDNHAMQVEVSWAKFANALQKQFLRATKQHSVTPSRCLSTYDLQYLNLKLFGTSMTGFNTL